MVFSKHIWCFIFSRNILRAAYMVFPNLIPCIIFKINLYTIYVAHKMFSPYMVFLKIHHLCYLFLFFQIWCYLCKYCVHTIYANIAQRNIYGVCFDDYFYPMTHWKMTQSSISVMSNWQWLYRNLIQMTHFSYTVTS